MEGGKLGPPDNCLISQAAIFVMLGSRLEWALAGQMYWYFGGQGICS